MPEPDDAVALIRQRSQIRFSDGTGCEVLVSLRFSVMNSHIVRSTFRACHHIGLHIACFHPFQLLFENPLVVIR